MRTVAGRPARLRQLSLDYGIEPKILSNRVRHSDPAETFQVYRHRSTGRDRAAADLSA